MRLAVAKVFVGKRLRKDYGEAEMKDLCKSMDEDGQITAITVRPVSEFDRQDETYDGEDWALVAGGRRLTAAALLGWETLEAYAREEMSELVHRTLELHENLKRKSLTWQEEVDMKAEIFRLRKIENPSITLAEVAAELGESTATLSRDIQTAELVQANPGLKKSSSKHTALNAGKELKEHKARELRLAEATVHRTEEAAGPLESRVYTSDALEFLRKLSAASIDLGLLDGPYGYNYWKLGQKQSRGESSLSQYDDSPEAVGKLYEDVVPELVRVLRPSAWLVMFCGTETFILLQELTRNCCATHFGYRVRAESNYCDALDNPVGCRFLTPEPYPWIWYRPNSRNQPRFPHLHARNVAELIFVCNMGHAQLVKHPADSVLVHDVEYGTTRIHVNQKPMELYKELIERLSFTGDSVLDCFHGSGNSLAAAAASGRVPYGCDSNPDMLPYALGRIRANARLVTKDEIQQSYDRYKAALTREAPSVVLESEEPENMPGLLGTAKPFLLGNEKFPEQLKSQLTGR